MSILTICLAAPFMAKRPQAEGRQTCLSPHPPSPMRPCTYIMCSIRSSISIPNSAHTYTLHPQATSSHLPFFFFFFFFSFHTLGLFYFLALSDGVTANVGAVHRSPLYTRALSPKRAFSRAWSAKWRRTWSRSSSAWRAGMRWMRAHIFSRASSL